MLANSIRGIFSGKVTGKTLSVLAVYAFFGSLLIYTALFGVGLASENFGAMSSVATFGEVLTFSYVQRLSYLIETLNYLKGITVGLFLIGLSTFFYYYLRAWFYKTKIFGN